MYPVVYIAGKYRDKTQADVENNIEVAVEHAGIALRDMKVMTLIPHTMTIGLEEIVGNMQDEFISMCCEVVRRCDILYVLPNWKSSLGTSLEIATAKREGIPTCYSIAELQTVLEEQFDT